MLKFESLANIGDTIKAYDHEPFKGRRERYIQGKIVDRGWLTINQYERFKGYAIEVEVDATFDGEYSRVGKIAYVPFEIDIMDYDNRVTVVKSQKKINYLLEKIKNATPEQLALIEEIFNTNKPLASSWVGEVDRQGGSFTEEEICNAEVWK